MDQNEHNNQNQNETTSEKQNDKIVELNTEETEQVVGGKGPRVGTHIPRTLA